MADLVAIIEADHRRLESLFEKFVQDRDPQLAHEMCDELRRHIQAEQLAVFPVLERVLEDGSQLVADVRRQHAATIRVLRRVEHAGGDAPPALVEQLDGALHGAVREEAQRILPAVTKAVDASRRRQLGTDFERGRSALARDR